MFKAFRSVSWGPDTVQPKLSKAVAELEDCYLPPSSSKHFPSLKNSFSSCSRRSSFLRPTGHLIAYSLFWPQAQAVIPSKNCSSEFSCLPRGCSLLENIPYDCKLVLRVHYVLDAYPHALAPLPLNIWGGGCCTPVLQM